MPKKPRLPKNPSAVFATAPSRLGGPISATPIRPSLRKMRKYSWATSRIENIRRVRPSNSFRAKPWSRSPKRISLIPMDGNSSPLPSQRTAPRSPAGAIPRQMPQAPVSVATSPQLSSTSYAKKTMVARASQSRTSKSPYCKTTTLAALSEPSQLTRILEHSITERPVLFRDFDQVDKDVFEPQPQPETITEAIGRVVKVLRPADRAVDI